MSKKGIRKTKRWNLNFRRLMGIPPFDDGINSNEMHEARAIEYIKGGHIKKAIGEYSYLVETYNDLIRKSSSKELREIYFQGVEKYRQKIDRLQKVRSGDWHGLEGRTLSIISIFALAGGIFFVSSNITGNVIRNLINSTTNLIGVCLIFIGLVTGFFWMRGKR